MDKYFVMLTRLGEAKFAQAVIARTVIDMDKIVIGDGLGRDPVPNKNQEKLVREVWRSKLTKITVDPINPNWAIVEATVPSEVGGFTVREVGILDRAGDLVVVGNYPNTFKPISSAGADKTLQIRVTLKFTNPENIKCVTIFANDLGDTGIQLQVDDTIFTSGKVELTPGNGISLRATNSPSSIKISTTLPDWIPNNRYEEKEFIYYSKKIYRCTEAHTSGSLFDIDFADGLWELISGGSGSNQMIDPTAVYYYDIAGACFGIPESAVEVTRFVTVRPFVFEVNMPDSQGCANTGPHAPAEFLLFINNRNFGKMKFPVSEVGLPSYATFETDEAVYFSVRDILTVISPEEIDLTMRDIEWTFVGKLVAT